MDYPGRGLSVLSIKEGRGLRLFLVIFATIDVVLFLVK